ncbi:MAG TPA: L,D-transpeptidase [Candidatus Eisenbacteria bacterium]|nr:L,D-transpeptidase [Candidatus Eisenbacteria bacterium]
MKSGAVLVFALLLFARAAGAEAPASQLKIFVSEQKLVLLRDGRAVKEYPVSTSKFGTGNRQLSQKTPTGRHTIARKIGAGSPAMTVFRNRVRTAETAKVNRSRRPSGDDLITTRILWLRGLEPGVNSGKRVDSFHRLIYIHGTPDEGLIGTPASHGCIRMKNRDVVDLFDRVEPGTPVEIVP